MTIGSEYRLQTMLGLLQILTCVFTMILAGSLGKLMEFISLPNSQPSAFISFVRGGGFLFILSLPILWAIFTIKKEKNTASSWSGKHTLISGILLIILIVPCTAITINYGKSYKRQPINMHATENPSNSEVFSI